MTFRSSINQGAGNRPANHKSMEKHKLSLSIYKEWRNACFNGEPDGTTYSVWVWHLIDEDCSETLGLNYAGTEEQARKEGEQALERWRARR